MDVYHSSFATAKSVYLTEIQLDRSSGLLTAQKTLRVCQYEKQILESNAHGERHCGEKLVKQDLLPDKCSLTIQQLQTKERQLC